MISEAIFDENDIQDIKEFEAKYDTFKLNDLTVVTGDYGNIINNMRCMIKDWEYDLHKTEDFEDIGLITPPIGEFIAINGAVSSYDLGIRRHVMKYICYAVNQGVKILFCTNDDIQIKELNNLILLANDFPEKDKWLKENKLYRREWSIDHKRVSAYERVYESVDINFNPLEVDNLGVSVPAMDFEINDIFSIHCDLDSYVELKK